jgi:hypothetical protein
MSRSPVPQNAGQHPQFRRREHEQAQRPINPRQPTWPSHVQTAAAAHAATQPGLQFPQPGPQPYPPQQPVDPYDAYQPAELPPGFPARQEAYPQDPGMANPYGPAGQPYGYDNGYDQWGGPQDAANYDLGDYAVPAGGDLRGPGGPAQRGYPMRGHEPDPYGHDDADYEDEEPPRSSRKWLIAAALIGSIGIGGGIAYGYKSFLIPRGSDQPPVVRASKDSPKVVPDNPGGKRFANADSKLLGRLESEDGAQSSDAGGVRRVSTVSVGRDGSLTPPEASPPAMRPTVSVPGLTIVDGFGGRLPAPNPPATATQERLPQAQSEPVRPAPPPQQVAAVKAPPAPPRPVATEPVAVPPAQVPPRPQQAAPKSTAAPTPPAEASTGGANGYVAVLASHRSRIDSLTKFADLQQKYEILRDKIPDVLEADLSARGLGTMYRLVVGPPGSREAASTFCGQIKSAGHSDCWITGY